MIVVIIAGGSGTRLWPLSTSTYPKHLLHLIDNESLLQSTYRRAKHLSDHVYVIPEEGHIQHVRQQLPELGDDAFIVEPARRGTASCVVAALHHIQSRHDHTEPIAFIHADHYVRDTDGFAASFHVAGRVSREHNQIVLVGVEPTYPSTGFGYIQKEQPLDDESVVYRVSLFKEKPSFDVAREYLQSGHYLWNCGYFVGSVDTFLQALQKHNPQLKDYYDRLLQTHNKQSYRDTYLSFQSDTIDYALIEKVDNLLVVPATFDWMDVGSFSDLHEANERNQNGNHLRGDNIELDSVENSYIRNEETKPVAVIGLDNVVVVNTPHGILVTRKDLSQKVGEIAKKIQARKSKA